jgi:hypothetical protein
MTTEKKNPNPFVNMANQAKKQNSFNDQFKGKGKDPKNSKGFSKNQVVRRSGRGG